MKNIYQPPIVDYALENNLRWLEVETQDDFARLADISNLAIAVSYGKLIPAGYLSGLTYGGLNVHPSLLPQYRGAAPLQRAIMSRETHTGVSVQNLHPTKFDRGSVLWRSSPVALDSRETTASLGQKLAEKGAEGLVQVLERGGEALQRDHAPPISVPASHAPIIDRQEYKIDFRHSAVDVDARGRALDKLWFEQRAEQKLTKSGKPKGHPILRVNLSGFVPVAVTETQLADCPVGSAVRGRGPNHEPILALRVSDGFVGAREATVAGFKKETASEYFAQAAKRGLKEIIVAT